MQSLPLTAVDQLIAGTSKAVSASDRAAQEIADKAIIQVEQFRVNVVAPKHNMLNDFESDDDFFHTTCHIEQSLKETTESGEYIDLERLLPKEGLVGGKEKQMELVSKMV